MLVVRSILTVALMVSASALTAMPIPAEAKVGRAADFTWSLGVNVHIRDSTGAYGDLPSMIAALKSMGFRHVRDSVKTVPWTIARVQALGAAGIRYDAILEQTPAYYGDSLHAVAPYLDFVEGPNEVDNFKFSYAGLVGIPAGVAVQKQIYPQIKADPVLAKIPVLNFTVSGWGNAALAGNMSGYADDDNFHFYPYVAHGPLQELAPTIAIYDDVPGKPSVLTETGYSTVAWNAVSATTRAINACSEAAQAKFILNDIFDNYLAGTRFTYLYELVDGAPDPENTNLLDHFGLFRSDWSRKPAAQALVTLHAILTDGAANAGSFTPSPLDYTLIDGSTGPAIDFSKSSALLEKASGAYFLVVWAEPAIWDVVTHTDLPAAPAHTTWLMLAKPAAAIKVFDPLTGTSAATSLVRGVSHASAISFSVVDHPVLVEVVP